MTIAEVVSRARQVFNETTAGFLTDATDIYDSVDSAEKQCVQLCLAKQRMMQANVKDWIHPSLLPLRALDTSNTTTTGSGYQEYSLPSDFLAYHYAEYSTTNAGTQYPCAYMEFAPSAKKNALGYVSVKSPIAYVSAEKLGFFPQPTGAGASNYKHYYIKQPAQIASGGATDFTLREETHEAILYFTLSDLYAKDKQTDLSQIAYDKAVKIITSL